MDLDIAGLPITDAAVAMLKAAPFIGAIIIFEAAAIVALALFIVRLIKSKDDQLAAKDVEIAKAKSEHIETLKANIPAMAALRETVLDVVANRGRRT